MKATLLFLTATAVVAAAIVMLSQEDEYTKAKRKLDRNAKTLEDRIFYLMDLGLEVI